MSWASQEGLPYPLGVSWCADDRAYNFALYSKHATEVRLLMFATPDALVPKVDVALDPLANKSGRVWHCRVDETRAAGCRYYAYVVDGPQATPPFIAPGSRRGPLGWERDGSSHARALRHESTDGSGRCGLAGFVGWNC